MVRPMKGRVLVKVTDKQSTSVIVGATEKTRTVVASSDEDVRVGDLIPHVVESPSCKVVTEEFGLVYAVKVSDIQAVLR